MRIRRGLSRMVLLIGAYAIKFPNPCNGDGMFVHGMLGNVLERSRWNQSRHHPALAQVIYCCPLGLFSIMRRYDDSDTSPLTPAEFATLPFINIDTNRENFARTPHGIVVLDYGNTDMYYRENWHGI